MRHWQNVCTFWEEQVTLGRTCVASAARWLAVGAQDTLRPRMPPMSLGLGGGEVTCPPLWGEGEERTI